MFDLLIKKEFTNVIAKIRHFEKSKKEFFKVYKLLM